MRSQRSTARRQHVQKTINILFAVALVVGLLPTVVFADEGNAQDNAQTGAPLQDITYEKILGGAAEYGVVADTFNQGSTHTETNFAVKHYSSQTNTDIDLTNDVDIPVIVGEIDNILRFGNKSSSTNIDITMRSEDRGKVKHDSDTISIAEKFESQSTINAKVEDLLDTPMSMSKTFADAETTSGIEIDIDNKVLDVTGCGAGTVIVNPRDLVDSQKRKPDQNFWNGCPLIKFKSGQNIVINVDDSFPMSEIREYKVSVDGGEEIATNKQTHSGEDGEINKKLDQQVLRHVTWNILSTKITTIHDTAGLFLNSSGGALTLGNAAGWVVSKGVVNSTGEWHFIFHDRHYEASIVLHGKKLIDGKAASDIKGKFSFKLTRVADEQGALLSDDALTQTVTTDEDGSFSFDSIHYEGHAIGKKYFYKIEEVNVPSGYTALTEPIIATIAISKSTSDDHILIVDCNMPEAGYEFNNATDGDDAKGSIELEAKKILNGRALNTGEFAFSVSDENGNVVSIGTNDADGKIAFEAINYTLADLGGQKEKTFTYSINEDAGKLGGVTYDDSTKTVVVKVTDNGDGTLKAEVTYPDGDVEFLNEYAAKDVSVVLNATKKFDGGKLEAGMFSFNLKDADGNIVETVENDANGNIAFSELTFREVGEYRYSISEMAGNVENVKYDDSVFTVAITVSDNGEGKLVASINTEDQKIEFTNTVVSDNDGDKSVTPKDTEDQKAKSSNEHDGIVNTEDSSNLIMPLGAGITSFIVLIVLDLIRRRYLA